MRLIHTLKSLTVIAAVASMTTACSDELEQGRGTENGNALRFNVEDIQTMTSADQLPINELAPKRLAMAGNGLSEATVTETTLNGINPKQVGNGMTRARVLTALENNFTIMAKSGSAAGSLGDVWFSNYSATKEGALVTRTLWDASKPYSQFIGVYPAVEDNNANIKLSDFTASASPTITFTAETDVTKQVDLMTATSTEVNYDGQTTPGAVPLRFHHALTAVRIALGSNASAAGKTIDRVEIQNAIGGGVYTIPSQADQTGTWNTTGYERKSFSLNDLNVKVSDAQGTVLGEGDNYAFLMVPQTLTGNNVRLYIHFKDNTYAFARLSGEWKPGTTKTYIIGTTKDDYVFLSTDPQVVAYDGTTTTTYGVQSYRFTGSSLEPVEWNITGYEVSTDGGKTWTKAEGTEFVTSTGLTPSAAGTLPGSIAARYVSARMQANYVDSLAIRNNLLKNATAKGASGNPFNLAGGTSGGNANVETANAYVISAPGYYSLPLVYGNAITDSKDNEKAYKPGTTGANFSANFTDHAGNPISSPYINVQNSSAPATQASLVWQDHSNLVSNVALTGSGSDARLTFEVTKENIQNGNAVVAVRNASGTIMWSWHLWFAPESVLETRRITNEAKTVYTMMSTPLGFYYDTWLASENMNQRQVRLKVKQANSDKESQVTFKQNAGAFKLAYVTYYQWGRKDPQHYAYGSSSVPHTMQAPGTTTTTATAIQNPTIFYASGAQVWANDVKDNYWDATNTVNSNIARDLIHDNVVTKTIYDPSPAGFHVPSSGFFTGLRTSNDQINGWVEETKEVTSGNRTTRFVHFSTGNPPLVLPTVGRLDYNGENAIGNAAGTGLFWTNQAITSIGNGAAGFFFSAAANQVFYGINGNTPQFNLAKAHGAALLPATDRQ